MISQDTRKCTRCGVQTEWTLTSVEMTDEHSSVTVTGVPAMVCPRCGEEYVPGLQAMSLSNAAEGIFSVLRGDTTRRSRRIVTSRWCPALAAARSLLRCGRESAGGVHHRARNRCGFESGLRESLSRIDNPPGGGWYTRRLNVVARHTLTRQPLPSVSVCLREKEK